MSKHFVQTNKPIYVFYYHQKEEIDINYCLVFVSFCFASLKINYRGSQPFIALITLLIICLPCRFLAIRNRWTVGMETVFDNVVLLWLRDVCSPNGRIPNLQIAKKKTPKECCYYYYYKNLTPTVSFLFHWIYRELISPCFRKISFIYCFVFFLKLISKTQRLVKIFHIYKNNPHYLFFLRKGSLKNFFWENSIWNLDKNLWAALQILVIQFVFEKKIAFEQQKSKFYL